jgi:3-methyl-2-oxobutanoate hydroxymethyltransferase
MNTKITVDTIRAMKARGEKIAALTAYDYPMARLLDEAGIPLLLVGDSVGMVVLGYPDTTHVTLAEMEHHVRAVARAKTNALPARICRLKATRPWPTRWPMPAGSSPPARNL